MTSNNDELEEDPFIRRIKNYVARNPSPRNPQINRESSHADSIESQMQSSGHRTWGYVIYRTTYSNNADWEEFMRGMRYWTQHDLELDNGQDILELMTWTVFEDQSLFDGASTAYVRQLFKQWAQTAVKAEQEEGGNGNDSTSLGWGPRYRYCIQVDEEALRSVLQGVAPGDHARGSRGWVKVIERDWMLRRDDPVWTRYRELGNRIDDTVYEPIDGVTEEHVGWIKCPANRATVDYYVRFQDRNGYVGVEERPPAVVGRYI